ncbi:MAG: hypothetical protein JXB24_11760, partial [Bacteroidales bacterium]|nr:hypothetical protein [Bacteroidales bacterium]
NYLLPELTLKLNTIERNIKHNMNFYKTGKDIELLRNEIVKIGEQLDEIDIAFVYQLNSNDFNIACGNKTRKFIEYVRRIYSKQLDNSIEDKDALLLELRNRLGGNESLIAYKQNYHNTKVEELVLNKRETLKIAENNNQLIRKDEPIFILPDMKLGRAHLFAPEKRLFNLYIDTYWFNLLIILLMALLFYWLLLVEALKKIMKFLSIYNLDTLLRNLKEYLSFIIKPIIKNSMDN